MFSSCASDNESLVEFDLPFKTTLEQYPKWFRYVFGVLDLIGTETIPNFTALIHSTVPLGGGLSSSASLEMASFKFIDCLKNNQEFQ